MMAAGDVGITRSGLAGHGGKVILSIRGQRAVVDNGGGRGGANDGGRAGDGSGGVILERRGDDGGMGNLMGSGSDEGVVDIGGSSVEGSGSGDEGAAVTREAAVTRALCLTLAAVTRASCSTLAAVTRALCSRLAAVTRASCSTLAAVTRGAAMTRASSLPVDTLAPLLPLLLPLSHTREAGEVGEVGEVVDDEEGVPSLPRDPLMTSAYNCSLEDMALRQAREVVFEVGLDGRLMPP